MDFDKMIEELSPMALTQLYNKCAYALNTRAYEHELAIRTAIMNAYREGYHIHFSDVDIEYDKNPDIPSFVISDCGYQMSVDIE